mmetsp:Transcript_15424/g.36634  ORF Transcript_15424/g.36634 Transcript_15424/m.36634 type:complete len:249 (+) Transcript_15424:1380-2126(+)
MSRWTSAASLSERSLARARVPCSSSARAQPPLWSLRQRRYPTPTSSAPSRSSCCSPSPLPRSSCSACSSPRRPLRALTSTQRQTCLPVSSRVEPSSSSLRDAQALSRTPHLLPTTLLSSLALPSWMTWLEADQTSSWSLAPTYRLVWVVWSPALLSRVRMSTLRAQLSRSLALASSSSLLLLLLLLLELTWSLHPDLQRLKCAAPRSGSSMTSPLVRPRVWSRTCCRLTEQLSSTTRVRVSTRGAERS